MHRELKTNQSRLQIHANDTYMSDFCTHSIFPGFANMMKDAKVRRNQLFSAVLFSGTLTKSMLVVMVLSRRYDGRRSMGILLTVFFYLIVDNIENLVRIKKAKFTLGNLGGPKI